jgi:hypothetical protein
VGAWVVGAAVVGADVAVVVVEVELLPPGQKVRVVLAVSAQECVLPSSLGYW